MNELINNAVMSAADAILGPVLDEFGTTRRSTGLVTWDLVDKETQEIIGNGREIAGDGLLFLDSYTGRSTLRKKLFGEEEILFFERG